MARSRSFGNIRWLATIEADTFCGVPTDPTRNDARPASATAHPPRSTLRPSPDRPTTTVSDTACNITPTNQLC